MNGPCEMNPSTSADPQTRVERDGLTALPGAAIRRVAAGPAGTCAPAPAGPQAPSAPDGGPGALGQTEVDPVGADPGFTSQDGAEPMSGEGVGSALPPRVIGLDLSLSSTGLADSWNGIRLDTINTPPAGDEISARRERLRVIQRGIWSIITRHSVIPDLIVVEGPSYGSDGAKAWDRAGLWWLVVDHFHSVFPASPIRFAVIPPTVVKKYATGKGTATKPDMRMALYQRAGLDERDDNKVDAWFLAAMGLDHLGHPPVKMPAAHRAALGKVAWPEVTR